MPFLLKTHHNHSPMPRGPQLESNTRMLPVVWRRRSCSHPPAKFEHLNEQFLCLGLCTSHSGSRPPSKFHCRFSEGLLSVFAGAPANGFLGRNMLEIMVFALKRVWPKSPAHGSLVLYAQESQGCTPCSCIIRSLVGISYPWLKQSAVNRLVVLWRGGVCVMSRPPSLTEPLCPPCGLHRSVSAPRLLCR